MAHKDADAQAPAPAFDKGDRAAIVSGRKGVGIRGEVFWIGENKYGPGMRYGMRGDDGQTYWLDASEIGSEEGAPPAPEPSPAAAAPSGPTFDKGDRVELVGVPNAEGVAGAVFWVGASRYGAGMRYGVRGDDGETYWADSPQVRAAAGEAPARSAQQAGGGAELPPEAFIGDGDDGLPPEAYEDTGAAPQEALQDPHPPTEYDDADLPPEAFEQEIPF